MILNKENLSNTCYGCGACANVCPKKCITLAEDEEGFRFPQVDSSACIDCGLCDKVCPIGKPAAQLRTGQAEAPACYYCYALDDVVRKRSASGGMAFTISSYVLSQGGVVFGVVGKWFEHVHHVMATTPEELIPTSNSKNIQSDIGMTYSQAKEQLESGRLVLFTGTPCQIAGLYSFLSKEYDNLITLDIVCHGVPSQKVLKAYIQSIEKKTGKTVVSFGRENTNQYLPVQYIIRYSDGSNDVIMPDNSPYRQGFLTNLFQRRSCYTCQYASIPRIGDVSLADMMISRELLKEHDKKNIGISLILVNSEKGAQTIEAIKDKIFIDDFSLEQAINGVRYFAAPPKANALRSEFYTSFLTEGFDKSVKVIRKAFAPNKRSNRRNKLYLSLVWLKKVPGIGKAIKLIRGQQS